MLFVTDNQNNFYTAWNVPGLNTRNKNKLYIPTANLYIFQKEITYSGIRIFNSLTNNIQHCILRIKTSQISHY